MRKRGESWELRVFLGNDPVTGKQRYATKMSRGGKREAQRKLAEMITEVERGLSVTTNATVGELLEAWLEMASRDFSPKTVTETRGVIDRNLLPHIGSTPLKKLRSSDLDRLYQRLQASGGVGGKPLAPATVRRTHGILRRALGQGVKWGWIGVNPAAATTPPRVPASDIAPPTQPRPEPLTRDPLGPTRGHVATFGLAPARHNTGPNDTHTSCELRSIERLRRASLEGAGGMSQS